MKKYTLLALLCLVLASCSEQPFQFQTYPHKEIRAMAWSADGQKLVTFVVYPIAPSTYQSKFYIYNVKGEKLSETPPLGLQRYHLSEFYLSSDGEYAIVGSYPVEIIYLATGKVIATYDNMIVCSQAFAADEFIVMDNEERYPTGPYYEYKKVQIIGNTIDTLTNFRLLTYYGYSNSFYPTFASQKRIITNEYDSLNNVHIVVRDSSFNVLFKTIPPDDKSFSRPTISNFGDRVIYGDYSADKFILDLSTGVIDTSLTLEFVDEKIGLSRDGNRIYGAVKHAYSIQSYDISSRSYSTIRTFPNTSYSKLVTLSSDDKHLAFALYDFETDDQLTIVELP